jgi:hypothetical protein
MWNIKEQQPAEVNGKIKMLIEESCLLKAI